MTLVDVNVAKGTIGTSVSYECNVYDCTFNSKKGNFHLIFKSFSDISYDEFIGKKCIPVYSYSKHYYNFCGFMEV